MKGPDGKPLEGARIRALPVGGRWDRAPAAATTDAAGRFRLDLASRQLHDVVVEAKGLAALRVDRVTPGSPLSLTLGRGAFLDGVVRDEAGQPVAGARVTASSRKAITTSAWDSPSAPEATSGADGRFRLAGLAPGLHTVEATAQGFGRATRRSVRPGSSVALTLRAGGWITGVVSDAEGRPQEGVQVRAEREPQFWGGAGGAETTDAQGRFSLNGVPAGSYLVVAQHPDFAPALARGVSVSDEGGAEASLILPHPITVTGRLVDAAGRPLKGRVTVQTESDKVLSWSLVELLKTESSDDGRFSLARLGPGSWTLGVLAQGYAGQRVAAEVTGREAALDLGEIVLERGLAIPGRLHTSSGAPVGGATISAYPDTMFFGGPATEARSEDDGSFVLGGLNPVAYNLHVQAAGYAALEQPLPVGTERLDLVMFPGGALVGLVVDDRNRPVDGYEVLAQITDDRRGFSGSSSQSGGSLDGRFRLDDLREGTYLVQVAAPDYVPASVPGVKVPAGGTGDAGTIRLSRGGVVRGTVVDLGEAAVAGASVRTAGQGHEMMSWLELSAATSDAAGAFEIRGVPIGPTTVTANHPDFAPGEATVVVDPAKGPSDVRVALGRGGRVEGSARRRDGTPMAGQTVQGMLMGRPPRMGFGNRLGTTTRADGGFTLEHVPPGRISLTLMAESGPGRTVSTTSREVEVREGETATVEFVSREILVSGRVVRSGSPAPDVDLQLWGRSGTSMMMHASSFDGVPAPSTGPERNHAVTREDGSFDLIVDEPGQFWVNAKTRDGRLNFPGRNLEVPDVDAHFVELTYSGVPLSGVVVDKATQKAVPRGDVTAEARPRRDESTAFAQLGLEGRFGIEVEPGDYLVSARSEDYREARMEVSVGPAGISDLRLELERGEALTGRILDAGGRGMGGLMVFAMDETTERQSHAQTLADGSFRFGGLADQRYNVCAGSPQVGFALRAGLTPGGRGVDIPLRPAANIRLTARGPGGAAVDGAFANVRRVDGAKVMVPQMGMMRTRENGSLELASPAGDVEIEVSKDKLRGKVRVRVGAGETVDAEAALVEERAER